MNINPTISPTIVGNKTMNKNTIDIGLINFQNNPKSLSFQLNN